MNFNKTFFPIWKVLDRLDFLACKQRNGKRLPSHLKMETKHFRFAGQMTGSVETIRSCLHLGRSMWPSAILRLIKLSVRCMHMDA